VLQRGEGQEASPAGQGASPAGAGGGAEVGFSMGGGGTEVGFSMGGGEVVGCGRDQGCGQVRGFTWAEQLNPH
jgi:hypothetical protein